MLAHALTLPKTPPVRDAAMDVIRQLRGELAVLGVTGVWLLGSVARGDDTLESDVDVAIELADVCDVTAWANNPRCADAGFGARS